MSNTYQIALVNMQSGEVQGHRADCRDLKDTRNHAFDQRPWKFAVETKTEAWEVYNSDFLAEEPDGSSSYDIHWLSCADHIPVEADEINLDVAAHAASEAQVVVNGVEFKACHCGCEQPVGKRSLYRPGHDARHAGQVARDAVESFRHGQGAVDSPEFYMDLLSPALRDKARTMALRLVAQAEGKKAAKTGRKTEAQERKGEIKIGRWTYPVRMTLAGKAERNTKRDGSGAWEPVNPNAASNIDWA